LPFKREDFGSKGIIPYLFSIVVSADGRQRQPIVRDARPTATHPGSEKWQNPPQEPPLAHSFRLLYRYFVS
jgi:hypothetical protein